MANIIGLGLKHVDPGPDLLTENLRIAGTAAGLIKVWIRNPVILHEMYLLGEANFIRLMREEERKYRVKEATLAAQEHRARVPAINEDFTDKQYGAVYAILENYVKNLAAAGAKFRKRQGEKMTLAEFQHLQQSQKGTH